MAMESSRSMRTGLKLKKHRQLIGGEDERQRGESEPCLWASALIDGVALSALSLEGLLPGLRIARWSFLKARHHSSIARRNQCFLPLLLEGLSESRQEVATLRSSDEL